MNRPLIFLTLFQLCALAFAQVTRLTFIRHGESEANADPSIRYVKNYDDDKVSLSALGRSQAQRCRAYPTTRDTVWWSSPMTRALQTTNILLGHSGKKVKIDHRLREMKWPTFATTEEKLVHKALTQKHGMYHYSGQGFESGKDVTERLREFLTQNRAALSGGHPNVIVCHEILMRAFVYLQTRDPSVFDTLEIPNCDSIHWTGDLSKLLSK